MDKLRLAIALERVEGDDPFPSVRPHPPAIAVENLQEILPDISIVLLRKNQ